MMLYSSI